AHPRIDEDASALRQRLSRSGRFWRGRLDLGIRTRRGRLGGQGQARRGPGGHPPRGGAAVGGVVFDPQERGKGCATEAMRLLTGWLLASGTARVQAETSAENAPMRAVLETLGFELEGILREYAIGAKGRESIAIYAVISSSPAPT